jgi:hypothetical protein
VLTEWLKVKALTSKPQYHKKEKRKKKKQDKNDVCRSRAPEANLLTRRCWTHLLSANHKLKQQ